MNPQDSGLRRLGMSSWALLGIIALAATIYLILASFSGLVVPLVVATVVGILFAPLVDVLDRYLPRAMATLIVLIGLIAVAAGTMWLGVKGVVDQGTFITDQVTAGLEALAVGLEDLGVTIADAEELTGSLGEMLGSILPGLASFTTTIFSSVAGFLAGSVMAAFFLYFILDDWSKVSEWVGTHLGVENELGAGIVEDTVWSMRTYFGVLTVSSLITGVLIGLTMWGLGLPLAFTIGLVTFVTSYIPYLGAIFSGAFAFLVALGSGGPSEALIVLAAVLVVQNLVQPLVLAKYTEDAMSLHPIVTFGSTIVGGALAGILGAALSAPVIALLISVKHRVQAYSAPTGSESG